MKTVQVMLTVTDRLKPLLVRIVPYKWLSTAKMRLVGRAFNRLRDFQPFPFQRGLYPDGINLIGNIKADTGLGQSCRLTAYELAASGIPSCIYQYNPLGNMSNENTEFDGILEKELRYNINLIHINPYDFGIALLREKRSMWDYRYNIGFWLWELEEFPDAWTPCLNCLDEIWTPSEFVSRSIRKKTKKPVITVPYHVEVKIARTYGRKDFGLPEDKFLLLMMYDRNSMTERKNPRGVLKAYKEAFEAKDDVGLVIKINNCSDEELRYLKEDLQAYRNLYFITDTLSRDQVNSLIKAVDVLVSLHRAEGFGLVMAEAMLLGTPVIATNWSSNTEFMDNSVACMVDYRLVELEKDVGVFKKGNRWADPNISQAAFYMRRLYEDREMGELLAANAQSYIQDKLSMDRAVGIIAKRVSEIYRYMKQNR